MSGPSICVSVPFPVIGLLYPHHSLTNKQLFNFSENRRPEVVFIGVNYVTFVSGYDPSANLSVVWCFIVIQQNFSVRLSVKMISLEQYRRVIGLYLSKTGGLSKALIDLYEPVSDSILKGIGTPVEKIYNQ